MFPHLEESCSIAGLALAPDAPWGQSPRSMIAWVALRGFRAVQLDASLAGIRARELDRSGRRDLAALLKRSGLGFSGLDLWIPPEHFANAAHADRALAAVVGACELAAELAVLMEGAGRLVAVDLAAVPAPGVLESLASIAQRDGIEIADHRWPRADRTFGISVGIDPAAIIASGADPALEVARLAAAPAQARLSDLTGTGRTTPGKGRLDLAGYEAALFTRGYARALVVDPRGLPMHEAAKLQPRAASTSSGMSALL
mgnify:CR=1 FL=1